MSWVQRVYIQNLKWYWIGPRSLESSYDSGDLEIYTRWFINNFNTSLQTALCHSINFKSNWSQLSCSPQEWCVNSKYCLPSLHADVERYISSCSLYPQPKSPYQLCTGTLGLLPDPGHAWSQIVTDFFFGSWWKYHILVVIASKICCFLPLSDPCFRWWRPCCVRCCRTFVFIAVWNYLDEDHHLESNSQVEKTNSEAWPVSTKPLWGLAG